MELISRKEAKAAGLKRYFTGKPCMRGHIDERETRKSMCVQCIYEYRHTPGFMAADRARAAHWAANNRARAREKTREWVAKNPTRAAAATKKWKRNHPDLVAAWESIPRVRRRGYPDAIVPGITGHDLEPFYAKARRLSLEGTEHHVDHIIPLSRGGKHHPDNLQVISAVSNMKKGAKLPDEIRTRA